jgi:opacity protein-like surface antigen
MKKTFALFLAVFAVAGLSGSGFAAEYDRYERGYSGQPPPAPLAADPPRRQRHATAGEPYIYGQMGVYNPNSDADGLRGYDSGGNFAVAFGSRLSPLFAVEGTLGAFGTEEGSSEVSVYPMTMGGRFIVPNPFIEPYIGAGVGIYFANLKEPPSGIDDSSTEFGGYLSLGMDFWLNQRVALNIEGRYHWVDASFENNLGSSVNVNLSGWTTNFGVRVSF